MCHGCEGCILGDVNTSFYRDESMKKGPASLPMSGLEKRERKDITAPFYTLPRAILNVSVVAHVMSILGQGISVTCRFLNFVTRQSFQISKSYSH